MMSYPKLLLSLSVTAVLALSGVPRAQADDFYAGKTIRVTVGLAAGGGYDTYARIIARHMGKHIPGNPSFVVDNMEGAGGLIAANHVYNVARPDGLTMGMVSYGMYLDQLVGRKEVQYDVRKFKEERRAPLHAQ